ncbi:MULTISPECIES: TonB-dependent siderophore receptor [unclassified Chitinophaga]|uniref:TonB-dependent siderophore receptor n=1 Tax=unclassified Chitinophaga TaxID=2619133 RepID=UPI0009CBB68C|nr:MULTISPECIES: TonB-dependent receptor [unclassified Chitinophaga]OMP78184.1 hypothetical protein BW716_15515 [[Flexibacter] sp. ATCC 35208]WPV66360.1 TonB-dependent receptor [Chitinophaga sp. LS1]
MKYFYSLAVAGLFCTASLQAQHLNNKDSLRHLNSVDIYGTRDRQIKNDSLGGALKLVQPLMEIPQNIVSVNAYLMQQQGALQLKDVARNSSGVYFGYNSSAFDYSASVQIRGFSGYTILNGMPRRISYGAVLDDQALFESVEFVKGPAGFINSVGEASGTININTKSPTRRLLNIELSAGSFDHRRVTIDAGTQAKEKGFSFRLNGVYQHSDTYLDLLHTDKYVIAPVVKYNFSPRTYILGEYDFIRGESRNGSSITKIRSEADALHDDIALNFNAAKGLPVTYYQSSTARLLFVHQFNPDWQLTLQSQLNQAPYSTWNMLSSETYTGVSFDENGRTRRLAMNTDVTGKTFVSQLYVTGKFRTGRLKHLLLAGGDITVGKDHLSNQFGKYKFDFYRDHINYIVNADSVRDMAPETKSNFGNDTRYECAYVYDNIKLNHWQLSFGGRYTWYNNKINQQARPSLALKKNDYSQRAFSPRAALSYLVDSSMTVYFLYDQSFVPQSGLKAGRNKDPQTGKPEGVPVDPQRNNDIELGVKKQWFRNRLLTTINGFHTVKQNVLMTDVVNAAYGYKRQIGEYASDGIEVDILGQVTSRFSVAANYTYVDARITKDTVGSPLIGNKLPGTPKQIINTWVQYSCPLKKLQSIGFSLGQVTQVKRATYSKGDYLPDFTKLDAGINFTTPSYYVRLIVDNLLNRRYISSGDIGSDYPIPDTRNYFMVEGDPINFRVTVGVRL